MPMPRTPSRRFSSSYGDTRGGSTRRWPPRAPSSPRSHAGGSSTGIAAGHGNLKQFHLVAEPPAAARSESDRLETLEEAQRARGLLEQLRPEQRQVLELSFDQGMSQQEIAEATRLPLGTVKTHTRRGLMRLRQLLETGSAGAAPGGRPRFVTPWNVAMTQPEQVLARILKSGARALAGYAAGEMPPSTRKRPKPQSPRSLTAGKTSWLPGLRNWPSQFRRGGRSSSSSRSIGPERRWRPGAFHPKCCGRGLRPCAASWSNRSRPNWRRWRLATSTVLWLSSVASLPG